MGSLRLATTDIRRIGSDRGVTVVGRGTDARRIGGSYTSVPPVVPRAPAIGLTLAWPRSNSALGVVHEQLAACVGGGRVAGSSLAVQERPWAVDGAVADEPTERASDDVDVLRSWLVDVDPGPLRKGWEDHQQGAAGGGFGARAVKAMDDDPVADLARLDLADVRFQERVRGHVASITGTRASENTNSSGSLVQQ